MVISQLGVKLSMACLSFGASVMPPSSVMLESGPPPLLVHPAIAPSATRRKVLMQSSLSLRFQAREVGARFREVHVARALVNESGFFFLGRIRELEELSEIVAAVGIAGLADAIEELG